jgi:putative DNA primase/helicase
MTAVSHLIVEIGELDSSFRKDVARLKGFLTADCDKLRRPYARVDSEYQRRTVFVATVNDPAFLVDQTGNTRFWVIPVKAINYEHGIDMQQLFAQVKVDFDRDEQWWLDPPVERCLEECNLSHRAISAVRERVLEAIDFDRVGEEGLPAMTASEVLISIGIKDPTNAQCKEAAATLRERFGPPKRIHGRDTYRVPLRVPDLLPPRR